MKIVNSTKCTGFGYEDDNYKSCSDELDTRITYEEFVANGICSCDNLTYTPSPDVDDYLSRHLSKALKRVFDPVR